MKKTLTRKELRHFGLTFGCAIALVFGLILPWLFDNDWPSWPWYVAAIVVLLAVLSPRGIAPIYAAWRPIALALGFINTRIILGTVFYLLLWPFGLALRVAGKLQYRRDWDSGAESYRVIHSDPSQPDHYEKPF